MIILIIKWKTDEQYPPSSIVQKVYLVLSSYTQKSDPLYGFRTKQSGGKKNTIYIINKHNWQMGQPCEIKYYGYKHKAKLHTQQM